jgi:DNA topoisomerase-1
VRLPSKTLRKEKQKIAQLEIVTDAVEAAEEAGLRYVSDSDPGYTRKIKGDDFEYFDVEDKAIKDEQRLVRIKRLAIPPAWIHVWICPSPNGHVQATGCDSRRRKQYKYHERWREVRDENKYERIAVFGATLPKIRRRVEHDLRLPSLPRAKVLATVVQLLERTFIRIGNEEYARENKSFGLTTMRNRHVNVRGSTLRFHFRGKRGKMHEVDVTDPRTARIVSKLQDLPGQELFQYVDESGQRHNVTSQDVNEYLRQITGEDFTAKDFRTWGGTVLVAIALNELGAAETKTGAKANIRDAISAVAKMLGNTPAICRKCYVHPAILENYLTGASIDGLKRQTEEALQDNAISLREGEKAVLKFLQARLEKKAA